jgi:hypothetical protein
MTEIIGQGLSRQSAVSTDGHGPLKFEIVLAVVAGIINVSRDDVGHNGASLRS